MSEPQRDPEDPTTAESVAILDFGSQYSQLIARRVREAQVYCELFRYDAPAEEVLATRPRGFILSGGPSSVYEPDAPSLPPYVLESELELIRLGAQIKILDEILETQDNSFYA